jgi:coenzyme PQQ synthesis protein D (PqqD)
MTMRHNSVRPSPDVIFRDLEGEAVLLDLASGRYFGLNAVGTRVWMLLESGSTVDGAAAAIAAEFDADPAEIARDVDDLVADLAARGLVVPATAPGAPGP